MGKALAYIRVSDDKQDVQNQRHEILEAARVKAITIADFVSITMTSRKTNTERRIDEVLRRLEAMYPGIAFKVIGEPEDIGAARKLAQDDRYQFQWWALSQYVNGLSVRF